MPATRSNLLPVALLGFILILWPTSAKAEESSATTAAVSPLPVDVAPRKVSTVHVMLSLAWEGRDLTPFNLQALQAFRAQFQSIEIMHLVSPAYFTKPAAVQSAVRASIRQVMRPKDQIGLLLGNWQSLANASGVIFRSSPTFWGSELKVADCKTDCGLEVPVNVYPEAELDKLLKTSLQILEQQGFGRVRAIAVEGWVASPAILEAAYRAGIRYDLSAVAPEMISAKTYTYPIFNWAKALWSKITPHSQPYQIQLTSGSMQEMPQSLAAIDYLSRSDVLAIFKEYVERVRHAPESTLVFPLLAHQESAYITLPLLANALQDVFAYARQTEVAIASLPLPDLQLPEDRLGHAEPQVAH